ncbi:MAG: PepSY domain-containing protein [Acidimicrobiales bacterium]
MPSDPDPAKRAASSRRWRSAWRIHFYSGMFAIPFLILMSLTGLVILYTQPIQDATQGNLRKVDVGTKAVSYDRQVAAVERAYPKFAALSLTVPNEPSRATIVAVDDGSTYGREVYVDPYTAKVLGSQDAGSGIVPLSNRLHGTLNNDTFEVSLPNAAFLFDDGPVVRRFSVGDMVLEVLGIWTLVLVVTGLFLFWPRKSASSAGSKGERKLLGVRWKAKGRARIRDLHGLGGLVLFGLLLLTLVSGMFWSSYWAATYGAFAEKATPGSVVEAPASTPATRGDLDRLGNHIPWDTGSFPIPASYQPAESNGSAPRPLAIDDVAAIAEREGMKPGYTISFPANEADEAGNTTYGSFTVSNSWPRKTSEAKDLFLDQFTGKTLATQDVYGYGTLQRGSDTLVSVHMGTQLGLASRIAMTVLCVLTLWSAISALTMFWRRRRPGTLGLPRRPVDVKLERAALVVAVAIGIIYPLWGLTALVIFGIDRFVIRKVAPLRRTFGQA